MTNILNKCCCWLHCCERHTEKIIQNIVCLDDSKENIEEIKNELKLKLINLKIKKEKDEESKKAAVDMIPFSQCQTFWEENLIDNLINKFVPKTKQDKWKKLSGISKNLYNLLNSSEKSDNFEGEYKKITEDLKNILKKLGFQSKTDYWHFLIEHPQLFNPQNFPISSLMNEGVEHLIKISKNYLQATGNRKSDIIYVFYKFMRIFFMQHISEKDFVECNFKCDIWENDEERKKLVKEREDAFHHKTTFFMNKVKKGD